MLLGVLLGGASVFALSFYPGVGWCTFVCSLFFFSLQASAAPKETNKCIAAHTSSADVCKVCKEASWASFLAWQVFFM